jgi:hypothetical protein
VEQPRFAALTPADLGRKTGDHSALSAAQLIDTTVPLKHFLPLLLFWPLFSGGGLDLNSNAYANSLANHVSRDYSWTHSQNIRASDLTHLYDSIGVVHGPETAGIVAPNHPASSGQLKHDSVLDIGFSVSHSCS